MVVQSLVQSSIDAQADADAEISSPPPRRASSRLQGKPRPQKELLVRRRVQLLDEHEDGDREGGGLSKRANVYGRRRSHAENEAQEASSNGALEGGTGKPSDPLVEKSDHVKVKETLRLFNKHYLYFVQEEEKRCRKVEADNKASASSKKASKSSKKASKSSKNSKKEASSPDAKVGKAKRPDLKALTKMLENKEILRGTKRIGSIPGIDVGHQFYSRAEMVAVGFHSHWLNGIDYMGQSYSKGEYSNYTFPLAVAIVISGMYEDDLDNAEDVVYTGQGGHNLTGDKRQIQDQVLERGNLALKNCVEQCVLVRVVRGHECKSSYCGKLYTYDGLYKVVQYWAEKGISGFTVFKYRLRRADGQPALTTNQVQFINGRVPQSLSEIRGLVCEDISGGQEDVPIPATNLVDDPPVAPTGFMYCKSMQIAQNVKLPTDATGCNCKGTCMDPKTCACTMLNGSDFPYVQRDGGRLIEAKDVVFECGPKCGCGPACVNRTSQRGLKYRFEVFRTPMKGWAVRSWDFIPSGAPVCEYIGILRRTEDVDNASENYYIFDIDCLQTMKGLDGRERRSQAVCLPAVNSLERPDDQSVPDFCIDAGSTGNIARFINHSCEPNLFVQCVLSSHHDIKLARIMLFAADNIPPLQELTYDYGYALDSVLGPDGKVKQMFCHCGATGCRKRLF
ncbi:PREDICTED: histone-lysine N-methyltransferase, H3 lysine-9 specific SUVH4 [Prunus mume]|uniref:Histone-lysine N-methyltransferase, H3 lysine-9 specific SUVH4 n=1 Tax=Prunus mume TaxID=102107 RepID=A0ABM0NXF4_PRUMU|nr:PREDICTED: histone-lysine N-methyltransferase, H3 lysine-9 specific SUVH4 [Prunus mume]